MLFCFWGRGWDYEDLWCWGFWCVFEIWCFVGDWGWWKGWCVDFGWVVGGVFWCGVGDWGIGCDLWVDVFDFFDCWFVGWY